VADRETGEHELALLELAERACEATLSERRGVCSLSSNAVADTRPSLGDRRLVTSQCSRLTLFFIGGGREKELGAMPMLLLHKQRQLRNGGQPRASSNTGRSLGDKPKGLTVLALQLSSRPVCPDTQPAHITRHTSDETLCCAENDCAKRSKSLV